jgi:hypothetical protein
MSAKRRSQSSAWAASPTRLRQLGIIAGGTDPQPLDRHLAAAEAEPARRSTPSGNRVDRRCAHAADHNSTASCCIVSVRVAMPMVKQNHSKLSYSPASRGQAAA